jgi:DNA (cytosine-5)-methyltransferase 1
MMKYGSLFSGIGGFDFGFDQAAMSCEWQVEIDAKCRTVLAQHWPNVPKYEDVRNVGKQNLAAVDLICGGFPCQDVSIAGRRAGLDGERSGLWFEFARIVGELEPQWVVVENVPGLLSSSGGRDFAVIIRGLVERGYGVCWRVLDAQFFGVAQRRRRVFVIGHLGDGRAAEILFERDGGARDFAPGSESEEDVAAPITASFASNGGCAAGNDSRPHNLIVAGTIAGCSNGGGANGTGRDVDSVDTLILSFDRTRGAASGGVTGPLRACGAIGEGVNDGKADAQCVYLAGALHNGTPGRDASDAGNGHLIGGVRRLTPVECERLQGFPDGWTAGQSNSARYRQLGNAVCVNVIEWIGKRIIAVEYRRLGDGK